MFRLLFAALLLPSIDSQLQAEPPATVTEGAQNVSDAREFFRAELASGREIVIGYSPSARTQFMRIDGDVRLVAGENHFFNGIALNAEHTVAVIHMQRFWNSGLWHWKFLVVRDTTSEGSECVEICDALVTPALQNIEGFRVEPIDLGSIDSFPQIDVYVWEREVKEGMAFADYHWQRWNIVTGKRVSKVKAEDAEPAERKAAERGDIVGWHR